MALKRITAPTVDLVALAEIKQHCRVDHSDDDTILGFYVKAAISHLETRKGIMGLAFMQQVWELTYDAFPCDKLMIPLRPVISVDSVEYIDATTGAYVLWADTNYTVDLSSDNAWIAPVDSWPTPRSAMNAVKITFKAGFGDTADKVPESIRIAVMLLAAHWYENRETVGPATDMAHVPFAVDAMTNQWREITV